LQMKMPLEIPNLCEILNRYRSRRIKKIFIEVGTLKKYVEELEK